MVHKIGKSNAEDLFSKHIVPLALQDFDLKLCHRLASIIMAYAFDIPDFSDDSVHNRSENGDENGDDLVSDNEEGRTILSMIPLADMFNADADRNSARLSCDNEDLEMRAIVAIPKGQEIFNDYGQLPQSDLHRRYGYITDRHATYNVAEISTDFIVSAFRIGSLLPERSNQPLVLLCVEDLAKCIELAEREDVYEDSYDLTHPRPDKPSIADNLLALLYILLLNLDVFASLSTSYIALPS